jgi:hypothetical protein
VQGLRWAAAEHLRRHKEEFAPFVLVQDIAGPGTSDADLYARYCDRVASSADWGGQIELRVPLFPPARPAAPSYCSLDASLTRYAAGTGERTAAADHRALSGRARYRDG